MQSEAVIDEQAAQLALMALRGTIPAYESLDEDRVRVAPDSAVLPLDAAARLLASMPKPLICYGERVRGILAVECELAAESTSLDRRIYESHKELFVDDDSLGELGERYPGEDNFIAVFSGKRSMLLSFASVGRWFRDYQISFSYFRLDDAFNECATDDPQYDEARRMGAKGILQLTSPARLVATPGGRRYAIPLPEDASVADRQGLEKGLADLAKGFLPEIEDEEELATVERGLVERAELPADSVWHRGRDRSGHMRAILASHMKYFFDGRATPPEVVAFIDACRRE